MAQMNESENIGQLAWDVRELIVRLRGEPLSGPEAKMLKSAFTSVAQAAIAHPKLLALDLGVFAKNAAEAEMRALALSALCKIALESTEHRKDTVSTIADGLKDGSADVRFSAALALRTLGENDIDTDFIVSMLAQQDGLKSNHKDVHDEAVTGLGAIAAANDGRAKNIIVHLGRGLMPSYHYTTRMKAVNEIAALGLQYETQAESAIAMLSLALQDAQAFVCYRGVEGIVAIGQKYEACREVAVIALQSGLVKTDITFAEKNKIEAAIDQLQKKDVTAAEKTPQELEREKLRAEEAAKEAKAQEEAKTREEIRQARLRDIEKRAQKISAAVAPAVK